MMANLKDSGKRTKFSSGAVREIDETKGRCDLVYNRSWGLMVQDDVYTNMEHFVRDGESHYIYDIIRSIVRKFYSGDYNTAYLELAKHYADGARKYADRNMEKGLPFHSLVDSALRHYTKSRRGDTDEPHVRACLWNLLTLLYMIDNHPELNDLPYGKKETDK